MGFCYARTLPPQRHLRSRHAKKLGETFDRAWAAIAGNFTGSFCDAARLQLATIILEFAADGDCNLVELKCRAIGAMQLPRAA
jgi:hypothetical protein